MSLSEAEDEIIKLRVQLAVLRMVLAHVINATPLSEERTRLLTWLDALQSPKGEPIAVDEFLRAKDALFEALYTDALGRSRPDS